MAKRGWSRHVVVAAATATATVLIYFLLDVLSTELWVDTSLGRKADGELWRYNVATGTVALILVVITLSIGPVRVLLGRERRPVHLPWRRATGVWAAVFSVLHLPGGLTVHSRGWAFWGPFERIIPEAGNLIDSFGVAYWAGLGALVLLAILALTSRDQSLRRMGAAQWKRLHRLAYPALALVIVHAFAMQYSERRNIRHAAVTAAILGVAVALQLAGFLRVRRRAARIDAERALSSSLLPEEGNL